MHWEGAERDFVNFSQQEQMQRKEVYVNQFRWIRTVIMCESRRAWAALFGGDVTGYD